MYLRQETERDEWNKYTHFELFIKESKIYFHSRSQLLAFIRALFDKLHLKICQQSIFPWQELKFSYKIASKIPCIVFAKS